MLDCLLCSRPSCCAGLFALFWAIMLCWIVCFVLRHHVVLDCLLCSMPSCCAGLFKSYFTVTIVRMYTRFFCTLIHYSDSKHFNYIHVYISIKQFNLMSYAFFYIYCRLRSNYQEVVVIPSTGLTSPHFCICPKPDFQCHTSWSFFLFGV